MQLSHDLIRNNSLFQILQHLCKSECLSLFFNLKGLKLSKLLTQDFNFGM